jgi:hypothetical protein
MYNYKYYIIYSFVLTLKIYMEFVFNVGEKMFWFFLLFYFITVKTFGFWKQKPDLLEKVQCIVIMWDKFGALKKISLC